MLSGPIGIITAVAFDGVDDSGIQTTNRVLRNAALFRMRDETEIWKVNLEGTRNRFEKLRSYAQMRLALFIAKLNRRPPKPGVPRAKS
jgi:hypothetical protein